MSKDYDKIFKENLRELLIPFIKKTLMIEVLEFQHLPEKFEYTIEREADAIFKIKTAKDGIFILHIEFQSTNDAYMAERMVQYFGMIYKTYKIPVRQCVFYIGEEKLKMKNVIQSYSFEYNYELLDMRNFSYHLFLDSQIPEEIILAILANKENEDERIIIRKILLKLQELLKDSSLLLEQKIIQLEVLSLIRDLRPLIIKEREDMALILDPTKDVTFMQGLKEGERKGKKEGKIEGKFEEKIDMAQKLLVMGMNLEFIQKATSLTNDEIKKIESKLKNI